MNNRLLKILKVNSKVEIGIKVEAQAKYYNKKLASVFVPIHPLTVLPEGYELAEPLNKKKVKKLEPNIMDKINSLRRTKSRINDIIRCNLFELFVTWTFAKDRYDIAKNKQKLEDWLKNQQKRIGAFEYVVVPELHKDGAIHFHGLLKGYKGEITPAIHNGKQLIKRGKKLYNFKGYKSGFSTIEHIGDTEDDQQKAGRYIQKYISKGFLDIPNQKRYWHSRGLRKPLKENNPTWYKDKTPIFTKKNDYGIYMLFDDFVAPDGWELKD